MQSLRRKRSNAIIKTTQMPPATALLLVDIQYDFLPLPESSLGVENAMEILPLVYDLMDSGKWRWVVVTASQDYHPRDHVSFASNHEGAEVFGERHVKGKNWDIVVQKMWPDHCVQGSRGAEIEEGILKALRPWQDADKAFIVQKGTDPQVDAYSSFASPDSPAPDPKKGEPSPLAEYLRSKDIKRVVCVGLATDFCVRASALASLDWGFDTILVPEAVRSIGGKEAEEQVYSEIERMGGKVVPLENLKEVLGI